MIKAALILITILPYPLRRDLRTNFYRYYFGAVYALKSGDIGRAKEMASSAYNTIRNEREAFLSFYLLGTIEAYQNTWSRAKYYLENAFDLAKSHKDSVLLEPWMLYVSYYDNGLYSTYELAKSFNTNIPAERIFKALYLVTEERYNDALEVLGNIEGHSANYIRSYVFYKKGVLDSALFYFSKLDSLNNIEKTFYATLLYLNGDYKKAHSIIKHAEKNDVYAVLLQAIVESKLGSEELLETYKKYKDVIIDKPEFGKIALMVTALYFNKKKYKRVVDVLEESLPHMNESDRKRALFYLGTSYVLLKRYANALKVWEEYLKFPGNYYDYAHFQLGRSAYELELDSIAKEHLIRLHDTSAYYFWGLYLYARVLMKEKLYDLAGPLLSYVSEFNVERLLKRRVYYNLGKIFVRREKWDSAKIIFEKMLQLGFEGDDVNSAQYLYEYSKFHLGEYPGPVELNLQFAEKYPDNPMVPKLLDEVITYFTTKGKIDSLWYALLKRRSFEQDSAYKSEFKGFLDFLRDKDTLLMDSLINVVKNSGTDFEKIALARKLIDMGRAGTAIDLLQSVSDKQKRSALLLIAEAYDSTGKMEEKTLVLKDVFPPYDSLGQQGFSELAISILKTEGIDSFYNLVLNRHDVPDSLRIGVLKRASMELIMEGDTLNALELKSRLKEFTGDKDALETN